VETNFDKFIIGGHSYVVGHIIIPAVAGSTSCSVSRCSIAVVGESVAVVVRDVVVVRVVVVVHTMAVALKGLEADVVAVGLRKPAVRVACCIAVVILGGGVIGVGLVICCSAGCRETGIVADVLRAKSLIV